MRNAGQRAALLAVLAVAGCGGARLPSAPSDPAPSSTPAATTAALGATPTASAIAITPPQDKAACALLYTRLQRVTLALSSSSELIAQSVDKNDLSGRIATGQQQLERSARLLAAGVVPALLAATNDELVSALRAFARDFAKAQAPAKRGDFPGAVAAMTDKAVVTRILDAATTIENACGA
jgi:hypothetical protein